jgi:hypothetical protein
VDEVSRFYKAQDQTLATHLALRWKGRVRYTVPREGAGQRACWKVFKPGKLGIPLRAKASWPHLFSSTGCVESEKLALIRDAIGSEAGLSCCRTGPEGVWSKDTILFLDINTAEPLYIAKAGAGEAVDTLLRNEADWLRTLRGEASLVDHIPELVANRSGKDFCFVAQRALSGDLTFKLEESHYQFLRRLQECSLQLMRYSDSRLCRTLNSRVSDLSGLLTDEWSSRLAIGMRQIERSFSEAPISLIAAHNDFTPWNVRVERYVTKVFDWEYADYEQLPLFDPLHFSLAPMALRSEPLPKIIRKIHETVQLSARWLIDHLCQVSRRP